MITWKPNRAMTFCMKLKKWITSLYLSQLTFRNFDFLVMMQDINNCP